MTIRSSGGSSVSPVPDHLQPAGRSPPPRASATSRSQFEPGKTMTRPHAGFLSADRRGDRRSADDFDGVVLDHRVGEQLPAHRVDGRVRRARGRVSSRSQSRCTCPVAPPRRRRSRGAASECWTALPCGSSTPGFKRHVHLRLQHAADRPPPCDSALHCMVSGAFRSSGPLSGRMPSRRATSW